MLWPTKPKWNGIAQDFEKAIWFKVGKRKLKDCKRLKMCLENLGSCHSKYCCNHIEESYHVWITKHYMTLFTMLKGELVSLEAK